MFSCILVGYDTTLEVRKVMSLNREFVRYVLDQLSPLGPVSFRAMFGGAGVYLNGTIFGLIAYDTLYLKTDESNRSDYEDAGMEPFRPFEDKVSQMSYYEVPVDVLEDRDELADWARKALAAAKKGNPRKKTGKKKQ